jgi:hypothetical protein
MNMEALEKYTPAWIVTLLDDYEAFVGDAGELAANWAEMDQQEQTHHRSLSMQTWGVRRTLGALYGAGRLAPDQVERLGHLDRAALEAANHIQVCYGPSLGGLVNNLLEWGTPLAHGEGTVRLDLPLHILRTLAQALAGGAE